MNLRTLIEKFLELNPKPSDAQVHALADAVGVDHQTLEAKVYEMLGEVVTDDLEEVPEDDHLLEAADESVLYDVGIDPDNLSLEDISMTDGDPTGDDIGLQEELTDDGVDIEDEGLGINQDVLTNDGVVLPPEA